VTNSITTEGISTKNNADISSVVTNSITTEGISTKNNAEISSVVTNSITTAGISTKNNAEISSVVTNGITTEGISTKTIAEMSSVLKNSITTEGISTNSIIETSSASTNYITPDVPTTKQVAETSSTSTNDITNTRVVDIFNTSSNIISTESGQTTHTLPQTSPIASAKDTTLNSHDPTISITSESVSSKYVDQTSPETYTNSTIVSHDLLTVTSDQATVSNSISQMELSNKTTHGIYPESTVNLSYYQTTDEEIYSTEANNSTISTGINIVCNS
jgi:hypothetical protein